MARIEKKRRARSSTMAKSPSFLLALSAFALMASPTSAQETTPPPSPSNTMGYPTSFLTSATIVPRNGTNSTSFRPTYADNGPQGQDDRRSGIINYYFVIVAVLVVFAILGIWFINKRRQILRERLRGDGQDALQRDVNGWTSRGRWINGHWRNASQQSRTEGLNELGQAPPPYKKEAHSRESSEDIATGNQPQIPLRALSTVEEERAHMKPPGYDEAVRDSVHSSNGPREHYAPAAPVVSSPPAQATAATLAASEPASASSTQRPS